MITDYTDPATVRALLGVSDLEIEDTQLALPIYNLVIESGVDNLSVNVLPLYATIGGIVESSRSLLQKRFYNSVQLYSGILVALELLPTLPMAAPRKIMDEKAALERVDDPYKLLVDNLKGTLGVLGTRILSSLAALDPTKTASRVRRVFASSVGLGVDPVAGV